MSMLITSTRPNAKIFVNRELSSALGFFHLVEEKGRNVTFIEFSHRNYYIKLHLLYKK